jgi:D-alanyl-D-alanine carboxypeptidase
MYPASLTKVMTAIVALDHGEPDMILTAGPNVKIEDSSAQLIGLKEGDTMTLDQALRILLIYSANDAAVLIAEGTAGSQEEFVRLMNEKAVSIGATNTHFTNPHGLTDENHYSTPYDIYLMMNEAMNYPLFSEIIHMSDYQTVYHDKNGNDKEVDIKSTNHYLQGTAEVPAGLTVIGGKTGTTSAAGHCLVLLSRDTGSNPFISVIMKTPSREDLYTSMTQLLELYDG